MVVKCQIEFDQNLTGTFYAGQLVSGTVILNCDKIKEVTAIQLKISGAAKALWSEKRFNTRRMYVGHEDYLDSSTFLMGSADSSKQTIALGVHTYTFACQLPENCPSSFEGLHGHIRYTVKVTLVRPWKFDQNYKRAFTVLRCTDLNYEAPHIRIPSVSEAYRTFCCGPCTSEPLKLELTLPQAGFVPGQTIPVRGLVINNTSMTVANVKFALIMLVRYVSQSPSNTILQSVSVSKVESASIPRNCIRTVNDTIFVPATPPTTIQNSAVIQIMYQVQMKVKVKGCHGSQMVSIPVIIGTVPLSTNIVGAGVVQQQPLASGNGLAKQCREDYGTTEVSALDLPPPSYEESVHTYRNNINEGDDNAFGYNDFAPLYPVFSVPSPSIHEAPRTAGGVDNRSFVS